ncbi:hypothetical protein [Geobacillus thermodenitrificans]|uniref:hypothetical protein n=1 Tax=Geobacillus thermodenitrificans TaxID=33940 RepID=UPI00059E66C4|nr:hypothetical protein [Geobacillus thermodenitrificans]MED0662206.1 hypothetical protein [Geobacillus thermodenitrificans]
MKKKPKVMLTEAEYRELKRLMDIVNNKNSLPGERRLAMARYDKLLLQIMNRNEQDRNDDTRLMVAT